MNHKRLRTVTLLATAAVLAVAALTVVPHASEDRPMMVTAQFEDSIGLYEGNSVSVLGMPVGKVTSIIAKNTYVEVRMAIDRGVDIPADVQAVTVSTSVLTDRHVELTPAYRDGPKLRNGDVLSLARTRTPVEFDRTLAMIDKLSRALSGDGQGNGPLADLINIGAAVSARSGPDIKATLDQLSQALRLGDDNGTHTRSDIQAVVTNLAQLTQAAADNDRTIREFGSNVRQLSDILAQENLGAGSTGAKANQILAIAADLLERNRDQLRGNVADFETVATAVNDYRRELAEFFDVTPLTIDNIYNLVDTNAGSARVHGLFDKAFLDGQVAKEICNLTNTQALGCATGTLQDYGPDFGLTTMLKLMAGVQ